MASLKRPDSCSCGSDKMLKEKNPERYVCVECKEVIVARGSKPDHDICRECKAPRGSVDFKDGKNLCMLCYNKAQKQYRSNNLEELKDKHRTYYKINQPALRQQANQYWQSTMEIFLGYVYRRCKGTSKKRLNGRRRDIEFNITIQDIKELHDKANGKCAISGLDMTHCWNSLRAVSIDRIDSSQGYIHGNVQLVCMWANLAKQRFSNDDIKTILDDYYSLRKSQESI